MIQILRNFRFLLFQKVLAKEVKKRFIAERKKFTTIFTNFNNNNKPKGNLL